MRDLFVKVIFPLVAIGLLILMFVWMIPKGYDIGGTVGILAMDFIIGGLIGGFVAVYRVIYAAFYILKSFMGLITKKA